VRHDQVVGDLGEQTAVEGSDGQYVATLDRDWEIWGPNGGYVAAVALRAAGAHSRFDRPASFSAHYLGVADFDEVQLGVVTVRAAKRAESIRVSMSQGERPIMEALVWTVDALEGLEHDEAEFPAVPGPDELQSLEDLIADDAPPPFKFWDNLENRPLDWTAEWPPPEPLPALTRNWFRFRPTATFDDPYADASRLLLLIDTMQWPAGSRPHVHRQSGFIAPTIDLTVNFHRLAPADEWLYCQATSPVAGDGLIGGRAEVWSTDRALLASGMGNLLCRPVPAGTPGAA
jgi:acyl-CoA thioesterase-2